ncbi:WD40 repeat-like protein [Pholiota conissans]|uniref:WD40 repeat-like protein n=1 Tax=Pholiota conissans TaxID=109636 RepID=A0A9P5ZB42_9AGAR|nr:WD40 repeat-like protein [Pholiota conissans]
MTIDYSLPDASSEVKARLLTCSPTSVVYFTRGNRVHHKNISTNSDVSQLCKYSEKLGNIRVLESGGISQANTLAIGSSKGYIHLWDVNARKVTVSWCATKEITALAWNGPILSVGGIKGSIRHYDTRLPATKMREQAHLARHRGRVTCLKWNEDGRFLASGDVSGKVHCWELGQNVPLNVGETVTRRKQIQHDGRITAIAWAPWEPKLFATGDDKGIMRLWLSNDKNPGSNAVSPGKVEIGAAITGIHFSPQCQEILTTHAEKTPEPPTEGYGPRKPQVENSITIHMHPSMRHGLTYHLPGEQTAPIGDSVLDGTGTKLIVAVPSTNKIEVCTAWAKRKELKKQQSFTDRQYSRIR